jgi:kanamycin kinase
MVERERLGPARAVWANEVGGLTFAFSEAEQFVKWAPHVAEIDMSAEADRLRWASPYVCVPEVVEVGSDDDGQWLRSLAIPGRSAVDPIWVRRPRTAARAIGTGLRHLHDTLPVSDCPFSWSIEARTARSGSAESRSLAAQAPGIEKLVVCHGDACAPNTLLDNRGGYLGHVDFGQLGVADRWADLAIATYSLDWNFVGNWEAELLDAYGIERDEERIEFYRQLWDAT